MLADLETMTKEELEALIKAAEKALKTVEARRWKAALDAARTAAAEHGYDLEELTTTMSARAKSKVKYRDPENAANTWSGKGRQPRWYRERISAGMAPEDMAA